MIYKQLSLTSSSSEVSLTLFISLVCADVILTGGTAGNVVANRLTENPNVNVLVLEAGGS